MGTKGFAFLLGTVAAGALLTGCVSSDPVREEVDRKYAEDHPTFGSKVGAWFGDRGLDLADVGKVDLEFGRGFGVNAHLTELLQAGIGWWDGSSAGWRGRAFGVWEENRDHMGLGPFYWVDVDRKPSWGTTTLFEQEYSYNNWDLFEEAGNKAIDHDWTEVGANVQLLAVGAQVAVSPIEIVDFAVGFVSFGLFDIMSDDIEARIERDLREEKGLGE